MRSLVTWACSAATLPGCPPSSPNRSANGRTTVAVAASAPPNTALPRLRRARTGAAVLSE